MLNRADAWQNMPFQSRAKVTPGGLESENNLRRDRALKCAGERKTEQNLDRLPTPRQTTRIHEQQKWLKIYILAPFETHCGKCQEIKTKHVISCLKVRGTRRDAFQQRFAVITLESSALIFILYEWL